MRWWWFASEIDTADVKYPLEYCQAFRDTGSMREVTVNAQGKSEKILLNFKPAESLLIKVGRNDKPQLIDLGFIPVKIE